MYTDERERERRTHGKEHKIAHQMYAWLNSKPEEEIKELSEWNWDD